jgi:prepilin-type N-terminal cleavage/methylation domain-containing protein
MFSIKKGFTLFELLIVIIIISVVYFLIIPYGLGAKKGASGFKFEDLKTYLSSFDKNATVTLVCTNECKKCYIFYGDKKVQTNIINKELRAYTYNNGYLDDAIFSASEYFDSYENICFRYSVDSKIDVGDEVFVKYNDKVYYFSPYFQKTKVFDSLSEASEFYTNALEKLKD